MSITKNKSNLVSIGLYLEASEVETLKAAAQSADGTCPYSALLRDAGAHVDVEIAR